MFEPLPILVAIANLIIALTSVGAVLARRILTGSYEILLLWIIFMSAMVNIERVQYVTPGQGMMTAAFALLMLNRYLREFFKNKG